MKTKPTAFKVMTLLLYGFFDFIEVADDGLVHVPLGPFARHLRLRNDRLVGYFEYLNHYKYITDLKKYRGYVTFHISYPRILERIAFGTTD